MIKNFKIFENINNFDNKDYALNYDEIDKKYNNFYSNCASSLINLANINKGDLVLELGAGTGFSTIELIKKTGNNVIATEYGEEMFNILRMKYNNVYKLDARHIKIFAEKLNLENKIDIVFSNFTYFYFYDFEDMLFKDICDHVLKDDGKYVFNITNFLTYFKYNNADYNNFYYKIRKGFDKFLKSKGINEGVGDDKIIIKDIYNIKKKLYISGFDKVFMEPYKINITPSKALDFMIENFYAFGFNVAWSSTLNNMSLINKMTLLKKGKEYIKEYLDEDIENPTVMNIIAYK
jgi:ubiquinone/menaquinone biosynthesis C-methylase UbiE